MGCEGCGEYLQYAMEEHARIQKLLEDKRKAPPVRTVKDKPPPTRPERKKRS